MYFFVLGYSVITYTTCIYLYEEKKQSLECFFLLEEEHKNIDAGGGKLAREDKLSLHSWMGSKNSLLVRKEQRVLNDL